MDLTSKSHKIIASLLAACLGVFSFQATIGLCEVTQSLEKQSCCCTNESAACVSAPTFESAGCGCTLSGIPGDSEYSAATVSTSSSRDDHPHKDFTGFIKGRLQTVSSFSATWLSHAGCHSPSFGTVKLQHLIQSYLI